MRASICAPTMLATCALSMRHELREAARLALDVDDARLVAELGARRRRAQGIAELADGVDQAALLGLRAGPDAALGDGVDLLRRWSCAPPRPWS